MIWPTDGYENIVPDVPFIDVGDQPGIVDDEGNPVVQYTLVDDEEIAVETGEMVVDATPALRKSYATGGHVTTYKSGPDCYLLIGELLYPIDSFTWAKAAETSLKEVEKFDGKPVYRIDRADVTFKVVTPTVMMCAFNATSDYLESILGRKTDGFDKAWFSRLKYTSSQGLAENMTATVLHWLVKPYGVGVKRVRLSPGYIAVEEWLKWRETLGCNPMDLTSPPVTSESFSEQCGNVDISGLNFDHGEMSLAPSVTFATDHSSYNGPRGATSRFLVSIQFGLLEDNVYHVPPPELDEEQLFDERPDPWSIKAVKVETVTYQHGFWLGGKWNTKPKEEEKTTPWYKEKEEVADGVILAESFEEGKPYKAGYTLAQLDLQQGGHDE